MRKVVVISMFEPHIDPFGVYVNTTSRSESAWERDLSPFFLGPCRLYDKHISKRMENAWQYTKVYSQFVDANEEPTKAYWKWAKAGWRNEHPVRYPMGKGRKPLYSFWQGQKFDYVTARKKIYVPLYATAVVKTNGAKKLAELYHNLKENQTLYLMDFDGWRHEEWGLDLTGVLNHPEKKMGHAFVLMMLLTNDPALKQCT